LKPNTKHQKEKAREGREGKAFKKTEREKGLSMLSKAN